MKKTLGAFILSSPIVIPWVLPYFVNWEAFISISLVINTVVIVAITTTIGMKLMDD